jgi:arylsulfatase A-like enzyme
MNFDLFPTILALAGVPQPQDRVIDGRDILPLLAEGAASPHEALYFYFTRRAVGVREANWKYFRRYQTDNAGFWPLNHGPFLFNLDTDPNESYSLVDSEPELAARLAGRLQAWEDGLEANLRGWLPG